MDNQQERLYAERGWIVAAIESEGWFQLRSTSWHGKEHLVHWRPMIGITNADPKFLDEAQRILNANGVGCLRTGGKVPHVSRGSVDFVRRRSIGEIHIGGLKRCSTCIQNLLGPYMLSGKRARMEVLQRFINHRLAVSRAHPYGEFEKQCAEELKYLNGSLTLQASMCSAAESSTTTRQAPV